MDKKKLIATLAAISLTIGAVGVAAACDNNTDPPHEHTFDATQWVSEGGDTHWHPSTCEHKGLKDKEEAHVDDDGDKFCDKCEQDMRQTLAVTIAPTTGGTVTADNLAPKEGETVTVTVAASAGYHVLSVKLGNTEQTLDANGKFTFKATAAVTITATFEGNEITLDASDIDEQYGSVAFKFLEAGKDKYRYGDNVVLHVTEDDEYILSALYINGDTTVNYADTMDNNGDILIMACKTETLTVTAEFVTRYTDVEITVKGTKLGTTANLAADTAVTFEGIEEAFTVGADGKITREHVEKSLYTVKVPGYQDKRIELNDNTSEIVLEFDTFRQLLNWGEFDFSKQNATTPELGASNDGAAFLSNESYDDVITSIYVDGKNTNATSSFGVLFNFVGEDMNDLVMLNMQRNIQPTKSLHKVHFAETTLWKEYQAPTSQYKMATGAGWKNLTYFYDCDDDGADRTADVLASDWIEAYDAGTLKLSALRKGNTVYAYLGDICVGSQVVNEKYATAKCQVGFVLACGNNGTMKTVKIGITDDADTIASSLRSTISISDDSELGVVTAILDKTEGSVLDVVKLTVTVPAGKKVTAFEINGQDVVGDLVFKDFGSENSELYNCEFMMRKSGDEEIVINVTTENVVLADLNVTIKGNKLGRIAALPEDTVVKFKNSRYQFNVENGKIAQANIVAGTYTVQVDGYFEKDLKVGGTDSDSEIVLEYDLLENLTLNWGWGDRADLTKQNEGKLSQASGVTQWISSKDSYDNVAVSATLLSGGSRQGVFIRFKGDTYAQDVYMMIQKEGNDKISWNGEGNIWGNGTNLFHETWTEYVKPLANDHTYKVTLVRESTKIYVFIDGQYYDTKTIDAKYADAKCYVGVYCTECPSGERIFDINEDVSEYRKSVTITDSTEANANGTLTISPESVLIGDIVTVTVNPASGHKLATLKMNDVDVTSQMNGRSYTFTATANATITATFEESFMSSIEAEITGYKLGVNGSAIVAGTKVTLTAAGLDTIETTAVDSNGVIKILVNTIIATTWRVKVDGFNTLDITTVKDGQYGTKIALVPEEAFGLVKGWGSTNSVIAQDGSAQLTITNEMETSITKEGYGDVAVTVYLSGSNMIKDNSTGTQGIVFRFSDNKFAILRMENTTKIQFACTSWFQDGGTADGWGWSDLIFFTDSSSAESQAYLEKFNAGTLKLTAVRKGATIYALLEDKLIGSYTLNGKYATDKAKVGMCVEGTVNGAAKTWKIEVGGQDKVDTLIEGMQTAVGTDKVSYYGSWTDNEGKLAVSGKGIVEFKAVSGAVKERVTIKIGSKFANNEQGLIYRFADDKYVAIRYQNTDEHGKVQYTMDTVLYSAASLKNWEDFALTQDEKAAFENNGENEGESAGINLTLIRDGNTFYVLLGDRLLNKSTVDAKYATMGGNMGIMVWNGKNEPFEYSHATGDDALTGYIPVDATQD